MFEGGGDAVALPIGAFARRQGDNRGDRGSDFFSGFFGGGVH